MIKTDSDTLIVGASLAGSFCGYLLGQNGYTYSLLEPRQIPKSKSCGEGLSTIGKRYLKSAGLWTTRMEKEARAYFSYNIAFSDGTTAHLNKNSALGYSIPREMIDGHIFNAAASDPLSVHVTEKVTSIEFVNQHWVVKTTTNEFRARSIVVACGKIGREFFNHCSPAQDAASERFGLSFRCTGSWDASPSGVFIKNCRGYQILLTPLSDDRANLSILASKQQCKSKSKDELVSEALQFAAAQGFNVTEYENCLGASSVASSRAINIPKSVYFIGDTAEIFDPIGGMGMSHALMSASLAAESLIESFESPQQSLRLWKKYNFKRCVYAKVFGLLTLSSFGLNSKESFFIRKMAIHLPSVLQFCNSTVCRLFPVVGAAKDLSESLSNADNKNLQLELKLNV